jgi:5-methylcytosine-specific restriction endonuclease McrA
MAVKPCLGCKRLIESGSYCSHCGWRRNTYYSPDRVRGRRWQKMRTAAMERAGWICQQCQERLADEVHHADGDPSNNHLSNWICLCRECHRQVTAAMRR